MIERTEMYGRPEGCICEQFVYLPDMALYPNSSDMNELSEMPAVAYKGGV